MVVFSSINAPRCCLAPAGASSRARAPCPVRAPNGPRARTWTHLAASGGTRAYTAGPRLWTRKPHCIARRRGEPAPCEGVSGLPGDQEGGPAATGMAAAFFPTGQILPDRPRSPQERRGCIGCGKPRASSPDQRAAARLPTLRTAISDFMTAPSHHAIESDVPVGTAFVTKSGRSTAHRPPNAAEAAWGNLGAMVDSRGRARRLRAAPAGHPGSDTHAPAPLGRTAPWPEQGYLLPGWSFGLLPGGLTDPGASV
jgi:hypothetical protein